MIKNLLRDFVMGKVSAEPTDEVLSFKIPIIFLYKENPDGKSVGVQCIYRDFISKRRARA